MNAIEVLNAVKFYAERIPTFYSLTMVFFSNINSKKERRQTRFQVLEFKCEIYRPRGVVDVA